MPLSPKAAILDALSATRLRELADAFGINGPRQAKADLVEGFTRNRRLSAERMLGELHRDELKQICRNQGLDDGVREKQALTDWSQREDIKAELKVDLIILLAENGYPPVDRDEVYKEIFEQAENFKKHRV